MLTDDLEDPADSHIEYSPIVRGYSDGNGVQAPQDLIIFSRYLANWNGYDNILYGANSDLDGDYKLTSVDLVILARSLANWTGYND